MKKKSKSWTDEDMAIVSDNPEWTEEEFARAIPASEFFTPEELASLIGQKPQALPRGPQKAPTKEQVTLRLSRDTLAAFRATGRGWQTRIDDELGKAARRIARPAAKRKPPAKRA